MTDVLTMRLCGALSIGSTLCILAALVIGISVHSGGPRPLDFGDPQVLDGLLARMPAMHWVELAALAGPVLGLLGGFGWHALLRNAGFPVVPGIFAWALGMVFVIAQDAAELALVEQLPVAYASADAASRPALLAVGASVGAVIETWMVLGDVVSFFGLVLVGIALVRVRGRWRYLGGVAVLSSVLIVAGLVIPALGPARLVGFLLFMGWGVATAIAMLRGRIVPA